jgi:hypothetical protein
MAVKPSIRLSDAERERVVIQLRDALGEGRLDVDDFNTRLDMAYTAKTHGEVVPLTADLPRPRRRKTRAQRLRREVREFAGVNAVLWGIWGGQVLTGGSARDLWPLFVTIPWASWIVVRAAISPPRPRLDRPR